METYKLYIYILSTRITIRTYVCPIEVGSRALAFIRRCCFLCIFFPLFYSLLRINKSSCLFGLLTCNCQMLPVFTRKRSRTIRCLFFMFEYLVFFYTVVCKLHYVSENILVMKAMVKFRIVMYVCLCI